SGSRRPRRLGSAALAQQLATRHALDRGSRAMSVHGTGIIRTPRSAHKEPRGGQRANVRGREENPFGRTPGPRDLSPNCAHGWRPPRVRPGPGCSSRRLRQCSTTAEGHDDRSTNPEDPRGILETNEAPEDACRDAPELLPEVRRYLEWMRRLSA